MIDVPKYQIPKFENFARTYKFNKNTELGFAAYVIVVYYEFAYHQMINFFEASKEFFEHDFSKIDPQKSDTFLNRAWSSAYAMYVLLRTVIDASRKIKKEMLGKNFTIESYYKKRVQKIIDIANDIVKHPMFNGDNSYAYLPMGLGRFGEIYLSKWAGKNTLSSEVIISPEEDLCIIGEYLECVTNKIETNKHK